MCYYINAIKILVIQSPFSSNIERNLLNCVPKWIWDQSDQNGKC